MLTFSFFSLFPILIVSFSFWWTRTESEHTKSKGWNFHWILTRLSFPYLFSALKMLERLLSSFSLSPMKWHFSWGEIFRTAWESINFNMGLGAVERKIDNPQGDGNRNSTESTRDVNPTKCPLKRWALNCCISMGAGNKFTRTMLLSRVHELMLFLFKWSWIIVSAESWSSLMQVVSSRFKMRSDTFHHHRHHHLTMLNTCWCGNHRQ